MMWVVGIALLEAVERTVQSASRRFRVRRGRGELLIEAPSGGRMRLIEESGEVRILIETPLSVRSLLVGVVGVYEDCDGLCLRLRDGRRVKMLVMPNVIELTDGSFYLTMET